MPSRSTSASGSIWLDLQAVEAWIDGCRVFDDLSLHLRCGEHTALLGPNGSGKSSLVKLISRSLYPVVRPGSHLKLFGSETVNLWQLRQRLGLVASELEARIPAGLIGRELLLAAFYGAISLGRDRHPSAEQIERCERLLQEHELEDQADQPFGRLSDGQKRRFLLARALVHQPEVVVLDEPTNALDLKAKHHLLSQLRRLMATGTTLVMVTHQLDAIPPEMERVIGLRQGRVILDGHPDQVLADRPLSDLFDTPLRVVTASGYRQVLPG
jgi:iron complex transport system ATP-binding protein